MRRLARSISISITNFNLDLAASLLVSPAELPLQKVSSPGRARNHEFDMLMSFTLLTSKAAFGAVQTMFPLCQLLNTEPALKSM